MGSMMVCASLWLAGQEPAPKAELFGGYSWYQLGGKVDGAKVPYLNGVVGQFVLNSAQFPESGFVVDVNSHSNSSASAFNLAFGSRFGWQVRRFRPFADALMGFQRFSPKGGSSEIKPSFTFGGGLDMRISPKISVRVLQVSYATTLYTSSASQSSFLGGVQAQSGLVYNFFPREVVIFEALCKVDPAEVQAGSPVNLTVVTKGAPSKLKANYTYTYASTGGTITGNQEIASIDNTDTAAGTYKVTAKVAQSGKHKHPLTAACDAEFKVKAQPAPPTTSTTARAEQEPKAAAAAEAGQAHAEVQADAHSTTKPSSPLTASKFGTIAFERDAKRPTRVDNEAKAELDRFADALAASPDTKGIVVGYATAAKRARGRLSITAALRATNTKQYLSKDKGLDAARIAPYTGKGSAKKVELWMVPAGVNFTEAGTKAVDESKVKAVPRVPLKPRAHPRKATLRQQPK